MNETTLTNDTPVTIKRTDGVKWVRFNRPEVRNAINIETADLLREELEKSLEEKARVIVLAGRGGAFCSGADLKATDFGLDDTEALCRLLREHYHPLLKTLTGLPIPVIAAVDGPAAGIGCDIALACDIRLASETAVFSEIFGQIGLIPDGGGTYTLPRLVGAGRALEMALTCQPVRADQALEWGLVNHVYPADRFRQHVQSYVERLAFKAPLAVARTKQAIREAMGNVTFEAALEREAELQEDLFGSKDFKEGVAAFLQKRSPNFQGR